MNKKSLESGSGHIILVGAVLIAIIGALAYVGYRSLGSQTTTAVDQSVSTEQAMKEQTISWPMDEGISWQAASNGGWITLPYDKQVPACPSPLVLGSPTPDLAKATSILYPGQSRTGEFEGLGGTYKPHGGVRFDNAIDNNISIVMPFDGYVMRGTRLLVDGEIQYGFDIVNPCGIMIRLGHLRDLTPAFQAIADKLPPATEGNSQTEKIEPMVAFKTGDQIATAIGFKTTKNVGFDYGVYDLKNDNQASKNPAYREARRADAELSYHGLCWPQLLNTTNFAIVAALPGGDSAAGKMSDYCK